LALLDREGAAVLAATAVPTSRRGKTLEKIIFEAWNESSREERKVSRLGKMY
jgi:hypothetical protein